MTKMQTLRVALIATGLVLASAADASYTFNFNGTAGATATSTAAGTGVTFDSASFASPGLDPVTGNPLPNIWMADPTLGSINVVNPSTYGTGFAAGSGASGTALDATVGAVFMQFAAPEIVNGFSALLDTSTFGGPLPSNILLLDAAGNILYTSAGFNMPSTTSLSYNLAGAPIGNVSAIVLAGGKLYDNINVSTVPLPAAVWLFGSGLFGLFGLARRRVS